MALPNSVETAVKPSNVDAVPKLLSEVALAGDTFSKTSDSSLVPRLELLEKARKLVHALGTPREIMVQHLWAQVSRTYPDNPLYG